MKISTKILKVLGLVGLVVGSVFSVGGTVADTVVKDREMKVEVAKQVAEALAKKD